MLPACIHTGVAIMLHPSISFSAPLKAPIQQEGLLLTHLSSMYQPFRPTGLPSRLSTVRSPLKQEVLWPERTWYLKLTFIIPHYSDGGNPGLICTMIT